MVVTARSFEQIALEDPDRQWELHRGQLREKPGMSAQHNWLMFELGYHLRLQLDPREYQVRGNAGHLRRSSETYYVPDVAVLPTAMVEPFWDRRVLEVSAEPLPLVVEIWSPSTGNHDIDEKLPEYMAGDREIWRMHPYERTVRIRRRREDAGYAMSERHGGAIALAALPGVTVDLDVLFGRPALRPGSG